MEWVRAAARAGVAVAVAWGLLECGSDTGQPGPGHNGGGADATADDGSNLPLDAPAVDTSLVEASRGNDASVNDAGSSDAVIDVGAQGDGRVPLAPRCVRTSDAGNPGPFDAGGVPPVTSLQQIVSGGGPVVQAPTFISVTFPGDPYAAELNDFVSSIGCTDYWKALADYGVGVAVGGAPVQLTESAPASIDDTAIGKWLAGKIDNADPLFPRPVPDTVYVLWYPDSTTVSQGGLMSCVGLGGFHGLATLGDGSHVPYAVVPRCMDDGGDANNVAYLVSSASHELVETCSDPQPLLYTGYGITDPNHLGATIAGLSEIADVCEGAADAFVIPSGYPWPLQRFWSNRTASQGDNPCLPATTTEYFYAAAIVSDSMSFQVGTSAHPLPEQGADVKIAVGSSRTIGVRVVSTVAGGGVINVVALDGTQFLTGGTPHLTMNWQTDAGSVGGDTGVNAHGGDTLQLSIQKQTADPSGVEDFIIFSSMTDGSGNMKRTFTWGLTGD